MNQVILWIAGILSAVYGVLTAFAGLGQTRSGKIQAWAAWSLMFFGLLVTAAGALTLLHQRFALGILVIGLLSIHALTINNGLKMFGKINPSHHLARLVLSAILIALAYFGLK